MTVDTHPAETADLGLHDPLAESFPQNLQGRLLFWIAVAFSLYQIATAATKQAKATMLLNAITARCPQVRRRLRTGSFAGVSSGSGRGRRRPVRRSGGASAPTEVPGIGRGANSCCAPPEGSSTRPLING